MGTVGAGRPGNSAIWPWGWMRASYNCCKRRQVTGHAQLEVGQPEPTASLPAHAGLKGGLGVTKGYAKQSRSGV